MLQTRLTALDLIGFAAGDERPRQFVHMPEAELEQELVSIKVESLVAFMHCVSFQADPGLLLATCCVLSTGCLPSVSVQPSSYSTCFVQIHARG